LPYTVTTAAVIFVGSLVQEDTAGKIGIASGSSAHKILGRATRSTVATDAAGTVIDVEEGDMVLDLDPDNAPTATNIGSQVYATSDHEVGTSAGSAAKAGILLALVGTTQCRVRVTQEASL
jgi:hypothetical protein